MSDLLYEIQGQIGFLILNREHKRNAFDNHLLHELDRCLAQAIANPQVRVIVLKGKGSHFCAGADLTWMNSMIHYNEEENIEDALILGRLMYNLYQCPKPTIAMVQGSAFGGGAGLAAVCSIAIAATSARFCFSEVKLGLIPAVISPYVVQAIGARQAQALFMSGELFDAYKACALNLVHHCVADETLEEFTHKYALQIAANAPQAVQQSAHLVRHVADKIINQDLVQYTATLIAQKRVSAEGQEGLNAFLNKRIPNWN